MNCFKFPSVLGHKDLSLPLPDSLALSFQWHLCLWNTQLAISPMCLHPLNHSVLLSLTEGTYKPITWNEIPSFLCSPVFSSWHLCVMSDLHPSLSARPPRSLLLGGQNKDRSRTKADQCEEKGEAAVELVRLPYNWGIMKSEELPQLQGQVVRA